MKQSKPRNYVALALMRRNGAGAHDKTSKAKRAEAKRQLMKEIKKPSKTDGFFIGKLIDCHVNTRNDNMDYHANARNDNIDCHVNHIGVCACNDKKFIPLNKYASQTLI
ncbi:MAG TPA: hypothetical protein VKR58_09785 [Aquella sp.]|nr:hypothetical protein [Aquella sp.]